MYIFILRPTFAWRNFKNIFSRPLFTIIFRPEMLKFHPYSILTGDTMVRFVIFCVLKIKNASSEQISTDGVLLRTGHLSFERTFAHQTIKSAKNSWITECWIVTWNWKDQNPGIIFCGLLRKSQLQWVRFYYGF